MATIIPSTEVIRIGKMSVLTWVPMSASSRTGGTSWMPAVLMAMSMTIELVAVSSEGLSFCNSSMALMPNGVAALPSPNRVAVRLSAIIPSAGWSAGTSGNKGRRIGRTSFTRAKTMPESSAILSSPRNRDSTPIRPSAISAPVFAKSSAAEAMAFNFTKRTGSNTTPAVPPGGVNPVSRPCSSSSRELETFPIVASGSGSLDPAAKRSWAPSFVCNR